MQHQTISPIPNILPFQPELRPVLPTIEGNVDYPLNESVALQHCAHIIGGRLPVRKTPWKSLGKKFSPEIEKFVLWGQAPNTSFIPHLSS